MSKSRSYTIRFHQHNRVVAESTVLAKNDEELQKKAKDMADLLTDISPRTTRIEVLDEAGATVLTSKYPAHTDKLLTEVIGHERLPKTPKPQHW